MSYTITPDEFVAARRLHCARARLIIRVVMIVGIFGFVAYRAHSPEQGAIVMVVALLCGFGGGMLGSKWDDWRFLRQYHQNEELRSPMSIELSNGELVLKSDKSTGVIPRSRIITVRSNPTVTLLYRSSVLFHVVPTHAITPEIADFLGLKANKT